MWIKDYRLKNFIMFQDFENKIQYGINEDKQWFKDEYTRYKTSTTYEAKPEEIEKALRKEAKRRGFVKGVKFLGCGGADKDKELEIGEIKFSPPEGRIDWGLYCGNSWIYKSGKWGEVVKSLDLEYDANFFAFVDYQRFTNHPVYEAIHGIPRTENDNIETLSGDKVVCGDGGQNLAYCILKTYFYHKSEEHGANFYELVKEIQTKVGSEWKTFVIYKQLGSGLEFSREKEEFYNKFKPVYV